MNKYIVIAGSGSAIAIAVGIWLISSHGIPFSEENPVRAVPEAVDFAKSRTVAAGKIAEGRKEPPESWWVRRPPKDAARHARLKELTRRYGRLGASREFINRLAGGDVIGALNELKKQAIAGDPTAIIAYGDVTYWNCFIHRSPELLDSYTAIQMRESRTLPTADAEWFRAAFTDDTAFDKAVGAACGEVVNVDQAFEMVDELAKQGNGAGLWLASMTAGNIAQSQSLLRAAAVAGSADAQFEIAFVVLSGHQQDLLGTGPTALEFSNLLRASAEQIPQAEGNLATCEFYGCTGIVADPGEAVRTALNAAEHGFFNALNDIGPHLTPSQLDPIDLEAWKLIQAAVEMQCGESWSNVKAMKTTLAAFSSAAVTDAVRVRAGQIWTEYGADLGC